LFDFCGVVWGAGLSFGVGGGGGWGGGNTGSRKDPSLRRCGCDYACLR